MRYGDELYKQGQYCDAYQQYQTAQSLGNLDQTAAKGANQSYQECYPPTEVPATEAPTSAVVPTSGSTEAPTETPTATPTP
jgi:hypothetical protein